MGLYEFWESGDWLPEVEDELRMEREMKQFFLIILAMILLACGGYGVYGLNEQDDRDDAMPYASEAVTRREAWQKLLDTPSYIEVQCREFAASDLSQLVAEAEDMPLVVWMEDEPLHSIDSPFCDDPGCPCHTDEALFEEYISRPVKDGALKIWDAQALLWPER